MQVYKTNLLNKNEVAENTVEFVFERPDKFVFKAGQNINLKLPGVLYPDKKGPRRTFTLSSPPKESYLAITTRMSGSGFKKTLQELPFSIELEFVGPMGEMILQTDKPVVYIAGGIGITPFKSMLTEIQGTELVNPLVLFYSNKTLARAAWHDFFNNYQDDKFKYIPIITDDNNWKGESRRFDKSVLSSELQDYQDYYYYLCGAPLMVEKLVLDLGELGISTERIRTESFYGY